MPTAGCAGYPFASADPTTTQVGHDAAARHTADQGSPPDLAREHDAFHETKLT